jgi:hypothetical protein
MKQFFTPCVKRTLELIDGQITAMQQSGKAKPKVSSQWFTDHDLSKADGSCGGWLRPECILVQQDFGVLQRP